MALRILCTFPGRVGDVLWALPATRMISKHFGVPVDFATSLKYGDASLLELIQAQPYIDHAFAMTGWEVQETAPMSPRIPPLSFTPDTNQVYDHVFHLGYEGWPGQDNLPKSIWDQALKNYKSLYPDPIFAYPELDLEPWIALPGEKEQVRKNVFVGFSQEWIELKMGVLLNVAHHFKPKGWQFNLVYGAGMRHEEWLGSEKFVNFLLRDFWDAAREMQRSAFYFGCLSSQWVLANAMGKNCVVMEPAEQRWHKVFWLEREGNRMVVGGGQNTFDARHCRWELEEEMKRSGM